MRKNLPESFKRFSTTGYSSATSEKKGRILMTKRTRHKSVEDMVRNLSEDRTSADEFNKRLSNRQLVKALAVLRTQAGLSQMELADCLSCTQSKVSKLESGADADLRFGDILDYTKAVKHEMRIYLVPKGQKRIVDDVKMHALVIKRLLDRMVQLAGDDGAMTKAVAKFLSEAAFNLTRFVGEAAAALPEIDEPAFPLQVEAPEIGDDGASRLGSVETCI
jgi:predicted XRE-type DNA-binding protein